MSDPVQAVAVHCGDGRLSASIERFFSVELGLSAVDRVALPGGPAALLHGDCAQALEALRFFIEKHRLRRVILIQHQGCAFYAHTLGVPLDREHERQLTDLRKTADMVRVMGRKLKVEAWRATSQDGRWRFVRCETA